MLWVTNLTFWERERERERQTERDRERGLHRKYLGFSDKREIIQSRGKRFGLLASETWRLNVTYHLNKSLSFSARATFISVNNWFHTQSLPVKTKSKEKAITSDLATRLNFYLSCFGVKFNINFFHLFFHLKKQEKHCGFVRWVETDFTSASRTV